MSKKRGLSVEEKREKMMEIFYERKEIFQLKELEKLGPKEKGVTAQSVKDIVQSLVDDGKVDTDKIGTSVYFWAFPSKAMNQCKQKLEHLEQHSAALKKTRLSVEAELNIAKGSRDESEDRHKLLEELKEAKEINEKLKNKLQEFKELDPEVLNVMKKQSEMAKEAVNRWTDNVFAIKSWCKNKFSMEDSMLNKNFGIPQDFDYI